MVVIISLYAYSMYNLFSFMNSVSSNISANPSTPPAIPQFPIGWFISLIVMEGVAWLLGIANLIASIVASMQVAQGKPFHYPLLGRFY